MKTIKILLFALLPFCGLQNIYAQESSFKKHCISAEESKLYRLIIEYRKEKRLPEIPLSKSLSYVARQHVVDMDINLKTMTHAWSTCKYNPNDSKTFKCMWLKPSELTHYKANGYECVFSISGGGATAQDALNAWKKSPNHNNVITNKSIWKDMKWNALGVGIYKNYAAIWFGEDKDEEDTPVVCE